MSDRFFIYFFIYFIFHLLTNLQDLSRPFVSSYVPYTVLALGTPPTLGQPSADASAGAAGQGPPIFIIAPQPNAFGGLAGALTQGLASAAGSILGGITNFLSSIFGGFDVNASIA